MTTVAETPPLTRWMLAGALVLGLVGAVTGLVIGLAAYPPTAWFAVLEVGVPAAFLGGVLGAVGGTIAAAVRRS